MRSYRGQAESSKGLRWATMGRAREFEFMQGDVIKCARDWVSIAWDVKFEQGDVKFEQGITMNYHGASKGVRIYARGRDKMCKGLQWTTIKRAWEFDFMQGDMIKTARDWVLIAWDVQNFARGRKIWARDCNELPSNEHGSSILCKGTW